MAVHVARLGLVHISPTGDIKQHSSMTIGEAAKSSSGIRVLPHDDIPNTAGHPTIEQYLENEDADGFTLRHIDQTYVITYS